MMRSSNCEPATGRRQFLQTAAIVAAAASRASGEDLQSIYLADEIDQAVHSGVEYLISRQAPDGKIEDRGYEVAMTSLSIMAMASLGIMPDSTRRGTAMSRAIEYVLKNEHQDSRGYYGRHDGSRMYGHGITTLMLTEMLGMGDTVGQNAAIHERLVLALKLILAAQRVPKSEKLRGGWRYTPDASDSDLSVSVWQVMALRSAKNDGLDVPGEAIDAAVEYLRRSFTSPLRPDGTPRNEKAGFSYAPGSNHPSFTMTAAGLLAMQVCGQYDSPMVRGAANYLLRSPPTYKERFFYYGVYYYAQGMHQYGGQHAKVAEQRVADLLLPKQDRDGSWQGVGNDEQRIGRVYSTSLAILSLSVRYHYLPIYQR
ncbi:MAG: prenyltransferase/squalene oxidase repeat-containing protein [Planctomycetota bacterium]